MVGRACVRQSLKTPATSLGYRRRKTRRALSLAFAAAVGSFLKALLPFCVIGDFLARLAMRGYLLDTALSAIGLTRIVGISQNSGLAKKLSSGEPNNWLLTIRP